MAIFNNWGDDGVVWGGGGGIHPMGAVKSHGLVKFNRLIHIKLKAKLCIGKSI